MKKTFALLLLALMLAVTLAPAVFAADYFLIYDTAEVFTEAEFDKLEDQAQAISDEYGLDVVIITTDDMYGYDDSFELAMDYYDEFEFDTNGVLLLVCTEDRDVAIIAHGTGNEAFTDYGKDVMLDRYIVPELKNNKNYAAAMVFLDKAEDFLALANNGEPFDKDTDPDKEDEFFLYKLLFTLLAPLLIAYILCAMWKGQMKTAKIARVADAYIPAGGFHLTGQQDQFLYRTETREKIERESSSGGTSVNSRGYSGSSRKY